MIDESIERLAIPGVGGIIVKVIEGQEHILLQERFKKDAPSENGLLEVPAGRIREFENIFNTLIREVKEETGLDVTKIYGEELSEVYSNHNYKVINFMPFSCSQNLEGQFPFMVFIFVCHADGELKEYSDESRNYKWVLKNELREMLEDKPDLFFPMHYNSLRKFIALN